MPRRRAPPARLRVRADPPQAPPRERCGGGFRIQFMIGGERRAIRLGKCAKADARHVADHVQALATAKLYGTPLAQQTASWLTAIYPQLQEKLVRAGLIEAETPQATVTLGEFMADYIASRCDVKPASKVVWGHTHRNLLDYFGPDRDIRTITPGDADQFKLHLVGEKLAPTTINKRLQFARGFFHAMRRRRLIDENPFDGVRASGGNIRDRQRFITREEIDRVLAACPNIHWRVIVTLARYGGLRCPSEVLSLKWSHIDWSENRITVPSPKTEHHPGREQRDLPLFPELLPVLLEASEAAPEGAVYVVDEKMRKAANGPLGWVNCNLRTTFEKIIDRAGLEKWPRLLHNLRASRETELVERFPIQEVTRWLGNSPKVALEHYLVSHKSHFEAAVREPTGQLASSPNKAQRNAQHAAHESTRNGVKPTGGAAQNAALFPGISEPNSLLHKDLAERTGFEPADRLTRSRV